MKSYDDNEIKIGDTIINIESRWRGVVRDTETHNGDVMLVCNGVNWWTGEIDEDDKQWHAPADVLLATGDGHATPNAINMM